MNQRTVDVLRAAGISEAKIAEALELFPIKTRVKIVHAECPGCGSKTLSGDFICGLCSETKVKSERRFWQYAYDRVAGFDGRPIHGKPGPVDETEKPAQAQAEPLAPRRLVKLPDVLPPSLPPDRFEYLVTVGRVGRVIVAESKAKAARVAHLLNEDGETVGHFVLCMGKTSEPETDGFIEKPEKKAVELVEHVYRVDGSSGYERELKLAVVPVSADRV